MATEAQKRATAAWRERHNLKRVELLIPGALLDQVDARARDEGLSRAKYILQALETALGNPSAVPEDDRLSAIEAKMDALLVASQTAPASIPEHTPDHTEKPKPKTGTPPDPRIVALVKEMRGNGSPWDPVATMLNRRGLLSPRGKTWTATTICTHCRRHSID